MVDLHAIVFFQIGKALRVCPLKSVALHRRIQHRRAEALRRLFRTLFEKLPFTSAAARRLAEAQFTTALATFTASGMDTDTAMERASDMVRHRALRAQLESCRRQMLEGRSLAQAVYDNRVFEPLYARMLMSGARSGNLDQVLARLAQVFSEDANMRMGRIIDSVEPVLAGFLTVSVGVTLLAVMLPLIGILTSIG